MKNPLFTLCVSVMLFTAACTVPDQTGSTKATPDQPVAAPSAAGAHFSIVPESSWLRVRVYKTGPLARFGHDHVVASTSIDGHIVRADRLEDSAFVVRLPLDELTVDDPAARRAEGSPFEKDIPDKDRTATRRNMLGDKLLNAQVWPELRLTSLSIRGPADDAHAQVQVDIAGGQPELGFAFTLREDEDRIEIEGATTVTHEQLGLEPFSALGGALRVRDDIELRYFIVAEPNKEML